MFKEQFDFVIVDSAPVLPVADSLLLGKLVDGVLLSILRDVSRTPMVLSAQERLRMTGARILGAVVNGISSSTYSARYSYRKAPASA
jgi:Mrp family chromosome partitioning ATPase